METTCGTQACTAYNLEARKWYECTKCAMCGQQRPVSPSCHSMHRSNNSCGQLHSGSQACALSRPGLVALNRHASHIVPLKCQSRCALGLVGQVNHNLPKTV